MQGGDDVVQTADGNDTIDGGAGDDTIRSGKGNDTLIGGEGNDTLYGEAGDDVLNGGKGADNLQGGAGDDTYIFNRGDGSDTVYDDSRYTPYYWYPNYVIQQDAGNDTLSFGEGISTDDLIVKASSTSNDLIVALKEEGKTFEELSDKIVLKDWFNANNRIETFSFSDGTSLHVNDIVNLQGTEEADTVHLVDNTSDVTLSMQGGDDVVQTADGNDTIDGGAGDDTIRSGKGNDTLIGGQGNDTLEGGAGDDTYIFGRGDGSDTIFDTAGDNTLNFRKGITINDLIVKASSTSNDLIVALKEEGKTFEELSDKIVLKDWFNVNNRIETFSFSDGTVLGAQDITNLQTATADGDYLRYTEANDVIEGKEGNDTLVGGDGDDVYLFGRGDGVDTIIDIAKDNDGIAFKVGIGLEDIVVQVVGTRMIVALKEDGKTFEELSDKLILESVGSNDYGIEWLSFEDGTKIDPRSLILQYNGTENDDTIDLAYLQAINPNVTADTGVIVDAKEGYDRLILGDGNSTITNAENITVGNGNNEIDLSTNLESVWISAGDGNNQFTANDSEGPFYMGNNISGNFGDGNNTFLLNSGDGKVQIKSGDGKNSFIVSGDVDNVSFTVGDGNNTIYQDDILDDDEGYYYGDEPFKVTTGDGDNEIRLSGKAQDHQITVGNGDNNITIAQEPESYNYYRNSYWYRPTFIETGDGNNAISVLSGDGYEQISVGDGENNIEFTSDLDSVTLDIGDGDNTITQLHTEDTDRDEGADVSRGVMSARASVSAGSSYGDQVNVVLGDGDNKVNLSGKAQDHQISVGNGDNTIIVAQEDDSYNYNRASDHTFIETGDGNNTISVLSGDGYEQIGVGDGENSIEFTSDLDSVTINVGDGNNTITQLQYGDDDEEDNSTESPRAYYYGDEEPITTFSNNSTYINLGKGSNQVSLGDSNDSVYYYGGDETLNGNNTIDVGAGHNDVYLYSDTDQTIITGSDTFSGYSGSSYIGLGNGNNDITVQNGQEVSLELGSGDNHITVIESSLDDAYFDGGNNTIEISNKQINDATHSLDFNGGMNNITVDGNGALLNVDGNGNNTISLTNEDDILVINGNYYNEGPVGYAKASGVSSHGTNHITAGEGSDMIASVGFSSDTYVFEKGNGVDRLYDMSGYDSIVFGEGITTSNISVSVLMETMGDIDVKNYADYISLDSDTTLASLVIRYGDNLEDQIILTDWYNTGRVESFVFSDGTRLSDHEIVGLIGSSESEMVVGTEGKNTLEGRSGDDIVGAGEGDDTYVFGRGDGHDTFMETGGFDTIGFKEGITKADLILKSSGDDLVISIKEEGKTYDELQDSIAISNWFDESGRIERLSFSDGTTMELDEIFSAIDASGHVFYGTPDVDTMEGSDTSEVIMALESDDIINGNGGNDLLFGQEGNDTLDGGAGDDILYGGEGDDTYIVTTNSGNDTIFDSTGVDRLLFAEGISADDVNVYFEGNDLYVEIEGTTLKLQDWYKADNRIENFSFSDGITLGVNDILAFMVSDGDDYARTLEEGGTLETLEGNDDLIGGSGNDTLMGGEGDDYYNISFKGNDIALDSSGNDTLYFDASISPSNLKLTWQQGTHDLVLSSDQFPDASVTLKGWYDEGNRIEAFEFSDGMVWSVADIIDHLGTQKDDVYNGLEGVDNIINARGGDDIISTYEGNDTLNGGTGSDALDAGDGDDVLNGEEGDDLLLGGAGNDTYLFNGNFGHDTIIDEANDYSDGGSADKIAFGAGIDASNLIFKTYLNDTNLYIGMKESDAPFEALSNTITLTNWYDATNRIETISFSDGTEASIQELLTMALTNSGEIIKAYEEGGILVGTPQSDYLVGGSGADEIYGREDDDTLLGNAGNDTLLGEAGNDVLNGGLGNDTYGFGYGDGADVIHDVATESQSSFAFVVEEDGISRWQTVTTEYSVDAGNDTLYFAEGIITNDLVVSNSGEDLIIQLKGTTDQVIIKGFYESNTRIENFAFYDGTILSADEFEALLFTDGNDEVTFVDSQNHIIYAKDGDDIVTTGTGNDIIEGGAGNDTLNGELGDDVYVFGRGDGKDTVAEVGGSEWWQTDGGNDQILLTNGLSQDDIIVKKVGGDIVIGLKEEGKSFEEFSDTITIKDAFSETGRIESIAFEDGSSVLVEDVVILNQAPILENETEELTLQDTRSITQTLNVTDPDGDTLNYTLKTAPLHGELLFNEEGSFTYSATDKFIGIDSAVVSIDDGNGGVVEQTLNFNLSVSAPTITTVSETLAEDTTLANSLHVNNPIGGELSYEIVEASGNGSFSLDTDGSYVYSPLANYNGLDTVTIKVTNEYGLSSTQTLNLNITPINDAPELTEDTLNYTLKNIRDVQGQVEATDIDGDTLSYSISSQANHGVVSVDAEGNWSYKADGSYNGSDSAIISIDDGNGGVVTQTLNFEIQGYIYEGEDLVIDDTTNDTLDISNLSKDDLSFKQSGDDLLITLLDTNTITLKNYFTDTNAGVEKLITKEGEINLTRDVINESRYGGYIALDSQDHLIIGDGCFNWLIGNNGNDILFGNERGDYISGGKGNDLLVGGEGNDNLQGNSGDDHLYGDSGNDQLYGGEGSDTLSGGEGSDMLFGENGDDAISGGSGNDTIYAGNGDDTLKGGTGDDFIDGSYGSDTYHFNIGDGADTIVDTAAYGSNDTDTLILGEGITKENLQLIRDNYDLVLQVNDTDSVRVKYWFNAGQSNAIEQITFSDGTTLNTQEVNTLALTKGTQNNDWLFGLNNLGDNLYGMEGNDRLYGYGGDDFLSGGEGDDFMEGGSGSDTYTFSKGDGADTINEWKYWNDTDIDTISFTQDVSKEDISFILSGTDLLIQYSNEDTIKVANTYNHTTAPIERLELSDGSYLTNDTINRIIQEINAYATDKGMTNLTNDTIKSNQDLMQIVSSGWQSA
jgi:Ca2+-binding RTX toxin-like protein